MSERIPSANETSKIDKRIYLNLGCPRLCEGFVCVDLMPREEGVIKGEATEYLRSLPNNSVTIIRTHNMLEHLANPQAFLDLCYEKLANQGRIELITDNAGFVPFYFPHLFRNRFGIGAHSSNEYAIRMNQSLHYSIFTKLHLKNRFALAGFTDFEVRRIMFGARLLVNAKKNSSQRDNQNH